MKKYKIVILILFLAAIWGAVRWSQGASITAVHPALGPAVQAVYATGTVEATVMIPIASRISARLMELNVDEGKTVTKGEVLAQLEDEDLQHSIKQLQVQEDFAKREFDRNDDLVKHNIVSKQAYDQAKSNLEAAQSATHAAQAQANYLKLLAPADGLIIKRDGEIGQVIPANQPVFWLSCCAPLRISAEVDEEDIAQVKPNQAVLIRADAFPGQVFNGKVQAVTPKGDPIARSYRVRVEFTGETPLQIGMTAETNIIIGEQKDALRLLLKLGGGLPTSAVPETERA
jgi:RND family efflux transporter MFP subunit